MSPARRLLAIVLAALAVPLAVAGAAAAQAPIPASDALSTNVQAVANFGWPANPYLTTAAANGWPGARSDAFWIAVDKGPGSYDWTAFDNLKDLMEAGGVRWQPILEGSPGWANGKGGSRFTLPDKAHYAAFAAFAAAFAQRYGPGGAKAGALPVLDVEIANEENSSNAGAYTPNPADYGELYTATRGAIHAVQPAMRVVVGAVLYDSSPPTDADYIKGIFASPGFAGADAIGLHPYAPTAVGVATNIRRMQQGLADAGAAAVPIYVNELGYPAALDGAVPQIQAVKGPTTDEARAATVSILTDALLGSDCGVRNIAYFDLVNSESNKADTDYLSSETWKGLERRAGAALTVTGQAFRDAGTRWRASGVPGTVHVCGSSAGPATAPLPLELAIDRPSGSCISPVVTYRGFPLEEATVWIRKPDGSNQHFLTRADGRMAKDFCFDDPALTYTVEADVSGDWVGVPRFALSPAYACRPGTTSACPPAPSSATGGGGGAGGGGGSGGGQGSGAGGDQGTAAVGDLSPAGGCVATSFAVSGSRRLAVVLRRGLVLRETGCRRVAPGDTVHRAVSITARLAASAARRLGLAGGHARRPVAVGRGSAQITGTPPVTVVVRFTARARARLAKARRVRLALAVTVREGSRRGTAAQRVTLSR